MQQPFVHRPKFLCLPSKPGFSCKWPFRRKGKASPLFDMDMRFASKPQAVIKLPLTAVANWATEDAQARILQAFEHCIPDSLLPTCFYSNAIEQLVLFFPQSPSFTPADFITRVRAVVHLSPPWGTIPDSLPLFQCLYCWQYLNSCDAAVEHMGQRGIAHHIETEGHTPTCFSFSATCRHKASSPNFGRLSYSSGSSSSSL